MTIGSWLYLRGAGEGCVITSNSLAGMEAGTLQLRSQRQRPQDHPVLRSSVIFPQYVQITRPDSRSHKCSSHLSFGRFFAVSTFFICGLPDSFNWLSVLSPVVGIAVREFILRSLQKKPKQNNNHYTGESPYFIANDGVQLRLGARYVDRW